MKKKFPMAITIISILIIVIYMITVNYNNKIKLENISGDIKELNDASLDAYSSNGIVLVNNFIINKDGIKKYGLINLYNNIFRIPVSEDKKFYRGNGFCNEEIYENNYLRFAANVTQIYNGEKVRISYREKKSGELIQFNIDADPNWVYVKAVYSDNAKHKIMFESINDQYIIVDVDLENEALKVDKILDGNNEIKNNLIKNQDGKLYDDRNPYKLDKWYFYNEKISNDEILSKRSIVSLDPNNYEIKEYNLESKKSVKMKNYHTYSYKNYIYDVIDENNELTISKFNIKNQHMNVYENIPLLHELTNNEDNIRFYKGFIKNDKLYCIFEKYNQYLPEYKDVIKSVDFYINVIDLNSKKSLYLGKVINASDIGFNWQGGM